MFKLKGSLAFAAMACAVGAVSAAEFYVAADGQYDNLPEGAETSASLDAAIAAATSAADAIYVEPGTYETTTQWGPQLKARLFGMGQTRDEVVIKPTADGHRALRMAADSWIENVTIEGNPDIASVDRGGAVEMTGGTVTNCVVRNGTAFGKDRNAGGNIYSSAAGSLIVDCVISGGRAKGRGGNVCLDQGTIRNCTVTGGSSADGEQCNGGNVWTYQGRVENCTIASGSADLGGNVFLYNAAATVSGGTISGGTASQSGGNVYLQAGSLTGAVLTGGRTTSNSNSQGGGNVYVTGNATVAGCEISDGRALNRGANVFLLEGEVSDCTIAGGVVEENASGLGGNVFMNHASARVMDCEIRGGSAAARGGNVFMLAGKVADTKISGGVCTNPTDQYWGGANVFMQGGTVSRCEVRRGSIAGGQNRGGGFSVMGTEAKVIEDTLVCGNGNGGIYSATSNIDIWNCTIVDNAEFGVYGYGGKIANFVNNVVYGNRNSDGVKGWSGNAATTASNLASDYGDLFVKDASIQVDSSDFVDYVNGDYRLSAGSKCCDAGKTDSRANASQTDLAGNPRTSGTVDIGCYEYQKGDMTVSLGYAEAPEHAYAPIEIAFAVSVQNAPEGTPVVFRIDFGDGTEPVETTEATVTHAFAQPGVFTIRVKATAGGIETEESVLQNFVSLSSRTICVNANNAEPAFPYDSLEKGFATVQEAYAAAVDGSEILVGAGTYSFNGQLDVTKAVTIRGLGVKPTDVVLRNETATPDSYRYRVLQLNNAGAKVENVTFENGKVLNQYGGNLRVAAGMVSNCVIRSGLARADNGDAAGGGVVLGGQAGILTHCIVTGNMVDGTSNDKNKAGAAVFVEPGTKNGRISNLLVAGNRYVTSGEDVKLGTAGVRYGGSNDNTPLENCTIVANTVEGSVAGDSAGLYCTSWHVQVRNCVIAGNYETGKRKCTSVQLDFSSGSGFSYLNNVTDDVVIQESGNKSRNNRLVSDLDRLFKNFAAGDYRPKTGGALVNMGTAALTQNPAVDLLGKPRVAFETVDVGCYEAQQKLGLAIEIR